MHSRQPVESQFEAFFDTEFTAVVNGVAFVIGDPDLARELVTDAVAKAWIRARKGEVIESLAAWTRTVAINAARTDHRRRGREQRALARLELPAPLPEIADENLPPVADAAHAALSRLSERQRQVAVMRYYHQLSVAEIATELEITEATVRTFLRRARAVLTGALSGDLSKIATVIPIDRARDAG